MTSFHRKQKILVAVVFAACLALAACGLNPADKELARIHQRMMAKLAENAEALNQPLKSETTTNVHLTTSPIKDTFAGTIDATLEALMHQDVTNEKDPLADLTLDLTVLAEGPSGTFGGPPVRNGPKETASLAATLEGRIAGRALAFSLKNIDIQAITSPLGMFKLPEAMKGVWYGITFDEVNAEIKKANDADKTVPPSPMVEEMIAQSLHGGRITPQALLKLGDDLHLWKGIEVLPDKDGMTQIRVESDKEKIKKSVRAVIRYLDETTGPSWQTQLARNPELKALVDSLNSNDPKELKDLGSAKGVVLADKDTAEFRGFDGDLFDASGALLGHIYYLQTEEYDITFTGDFVQTKNTVSFTKKGENVTMIVDDKEVLTGTVTPKKVDLTMKNESGAVAVTMKFDIAKSDRANADLRNVVITLPEEKLTIEAAFVTIAFTNDFKDMKFSVDAKGILDKSPLFTLTAEAIRKEIPSVSIVKPVFKPFSQLQEDFMTALMSEQQPGADGLED